jgi:hypothetical protein
MKENEDPKVLDNKDQRVLKEIEVLKETQETQEMI